MSTGAALKMAREAAGLTQQQVADRMGVHRVTLARWEQRPAVRPGKTERYLRAVRELASAA